MNITTSYTVNEVISIIQQCINIRGWTSKLVNDDDRDYSVTYATFSVFNGCVQEFISITGIQLKELGKLDIEDLLYTINSIIIKPLERRMR